MLSVMSWSGKAGTRGNKVDH